MIPIVCLDDNGGMMFGGRRQSRDRILRADILRLTEGKALWMNAVSYKLYADMEAPQIRVDEDFLQKAGKKDYCLVEDQPLAPHIEALSGLVIYRWNRKYPADRYFDLPLADWQPESTFEFAGSSHERITRQIYIR